jgi:hypothetical protein
VIRRSLASILLGFLSLSALPALAAPPPDPESRSVSEVWAREDAYWRYVKAGEVDAYRTLWDERFTGWPCTRAHPQTKAAIGDWVRDIRDQKISFEYSLTREAAKDFGDVVIVYYRTPMVRKLASGTVENAGREYKFTHTWMKVGSAWLIIGGMCGELPVDAK